VAVVSVIKFYTVTKDVTKRRKPLSKLVGFKAIIGLSFLQDVSLALLPLPSQHLTFFASARLLIPSKFYETDRALHI